VFDYLQLDAMLGSHVSCGLTDIGQLCGAAGDLLDLFGQPLDLGAVRFARRGHVQASRRPSMSTAAYTFKPLPRLAPDSGVDCSVRLSAIIAVGYGLRPANSHSNERTSSTMISKTSDRIEHCVC
jgi:hypothetical protein